jgi:tight adherence protein C
MYLAISISALLFIALAGVITLVGYRRYARPGRLYDQLGGSAIVAIPGLEQNPAENGATVRVFELVGEKVPVSPEDAKVMRGDLIRAGYRSDDAITIFMGIKVVLTVLFVLLALVFRTDVTDNSILRVVFVIAAGAAGWLGPGFYLERLGTQRQERLRFALPDALDLMVVSVEAGLALDQAIQHVGREIAITHQDLSEELALVNLEMRAGKRRVDALRNLVERTGEPEVRKLVAMLVQTDRFGTSVAEALRTHSDYMRVRRRQEAEERAGKLGVKLVFPIFFFILPSMLLVTAGPGVLQMVKFLYPMMKNFKM